MRGGGWWRHALPSCGAGEILDGLGVRIKQGLCARFCAGSLGGRLSVRSPALMLRPAPSRLIRRRSISESGGHVWMVQIVEGCTFGWLFIGCSSHRKGARRASHYYYFVYLVDVYPHSLCIVHPRKPGARAHLGLYCSFRRGHSWSRQLLMYRVLQSFPLTDHAPGSDLNHSHISLD